MEPLSIESLYDEYAAEYAAIAFDRDFAAENALVYQIALQSKLPKRSVSTLLELFAGPAWHSFHWRRVYGGRAVAIDSSSSMKSLATQRGHVEPDDYLLTTLPVVGLTDSCSNEYFSVVLALRYSIGYLNPGEMAQLLANLRPLVDRGGIVVLELHNPQLMAEDLSKLSIRTRSASTTNGTQVECSWPAGPINWDADRLVASMPVVFRIQQPHDVDAQCVEFTSTEYVYKPVNIAQACHLAGGGFEIEDWTSKCGNNFRSSTVLALRRH